jgi:hypothetical protein
VKPSPATKAVTPAVIVKPTCVENAAPTEPAPTTFPIVSVTVNAVADVKSTVYSAGNLVGILSGLETAVVPMVVSMSAEARDAFRALSEKNTLELPKARGTAFTSILARIGENARDVALIVAVGRHPVQPEITMQDATWAIGFVRHFASRTMESVERHVADNDTDRSHKRVSDIIRSAGEQGVTKSELIRRTQWIDLRKRNEVIASLAEGGLIKTKMRPQATRSAMVFRGV